MITKQQAVKELATRELEKRYSVQRESLYEFLLFYRKEEKRIELDQNRHIQEICKRLENVYYGKTKRLMINVPPRSLKTEIVSRIFPARCLGKKSSMKFMGISYSSSLAQDNSWDCRAIYESDTYKKVFPRVVPLKDDQNTKTHRENKDWWQYYASWSTWSITWKWCDCLTWDTIISTNNWYMRIDDLCKNTCNIKVNSYNGTTDEYKSVLAYRIINNAKVFEITLSTWDKIRTTWNHRIYILWQWYKKTQDLKEWDIVMREKPTMHNLLSKEMMKMNKLYAMLSKSKAFNIFNKMWLLLKRYWKKTCWHKKSNKKMTNNYVLYTKMLMSSLYEKILISLQVLLRNKELCKPEVLQWKMQEWCNDSKKENNTMHKLLNWYIPTITLDKILLYGLQKFTSFKKYALKIKSKLQTLTCIRQLSKRFLQSKKRNYLKRLMSMCNMLNKWKSCSSSQRQQSIKQRLQQLNNSLYKTSCNTSSQQNITVSSVISLDKTETVYDIQVAWNENFYANGILVHNCMLIDDPLKPDDADSDVVRQRVNNNYHNTLYSRLNSKTEWSIVIIMQRLHDDDLCGHLIEKEWDTRDKLIIRAIAEEDEEHRKQGESFFNKRFPLPLLKELQYGEQTRQTFSTQYQQEPVNKETQEFHEEFFKYYDDTPRGMRIFTTVDPAFKTKQYNDQTCIMTVWFLWDACYVLEYSAGRYEATDMIEKIIYHILKRQPEKVGIEAYQAQSMINTFLKNELTKRRIFATIEEITQNWDKNVKIRKLIPMYRSWNIFHKIGMDELENQLKRFPRGKHDDIIDALQMAYDLYQLQPNSNKFTDQINIERDQFWNPTYR